MKNNLLSLLGVATFCTCLNAQVGVNTSSPTEKLDVNGTLRVRSLPNDGAVGIYTTGTNTSSSIPDQTFTASKPLVIDTNGVMGTTSFGNLVPNNTSGLTFNTTNVSTSMFVVKRFPVEDTVGGTAGSYYTNGYNTGMDVNSWQAIISNVSWKMTAEPTINQVQFVSGEPFNYRLQGSAGSTWKIVGDIINVKEIGFVDVLFIKSQFVAADDRSN